MAKEITAKLLDFKKNGDERGYLTVVEGNKTIPFEIKRVFYIYGTEQNIVRGNHSNRKTEFVLIAVSGSCKVLVKDGLGHEEIYCLDDPNQGLYLPRMLWKEMYDFSKDCVLLVLASEHYDEQEYIRNFEELQDEMREERNA